MDKYKESLLRRNKNLTVENDRLWKDRIARGAIIENLRKEVANLKHAMGVEDD